MSLLDDLAKLGPLSPEQLYELARKRTAGDLEVLSCEHVDSVPASLYALPLHRPGGESLTVYLSCHLCCADALTVLGTTTMH